MNQFSSLDIAIFWGYLILILGVGIRASGSVKTLRDYSIGGKNYSSFFIFTTLSASFLGGGFSMGLAEKVFTLGIAYVVALWGFSIKEILIARFIAPRMHPFHNAISVGDIMGQLFGKSAKTFTGIAGALVSAGVAGAQFGAFGYISNVLIGIPQWVGVLVGSLVVIFYSTLGGMRSVVVNDTVHFFVLIVSLPLVAIFGVSYIGGIGALWDSIPTAQGNIITSIPPLTLVCLFLSFFFGETLVPPYVQRLLIGKTFKDTARGTLFSGLLSIPFFLIIGIIGLVALAIAPNINPNLALPHVIQTVMPFGFRGLAIAGLMAILMSSADSFLNAAAISAVHDGLKTIRTKPLTSVMELRLTRIATFVMGSVGALFAMSIESVIDVLLYAYNFWTPFILVPLVFGILGFVASSRTFWFSSLAGIVGMLSWQLIMGVNGVFDAALSGISFNFVTYVTLYFLEKRKEKDIIDYSEVEVVQNP